MTGFMMMKIHHETWLLQPFFQYVSMGGFSPLVVVLFTTTLLTHTLLVMMMQRGYSQSKNLTPLSTWIRFETTGRRNEVGFHLKNKFYHPKRDVVVVILGMDLKQVVMLTVDRSDPLVDWFVEKVSVNGTDVQRRE